MTDFITGGSNETVKWQAEPALRGTFTILSTCIITLVLCVYSSVHLNLPAIDRTKTLWGVRRAAWILCALLAPEFIIFTAQSQRSRAKQISKEAREAFKPCGTGQTGDAENLTPGRQHAWTSTHSFWALMGGIAIKPDTKDPFIPGSVLSTLTANGVSLLLKTEPSLLPDISIEEVKDKSKANSLTKLLACLQATWFCFSCITRFAQHLPVSMLELNSFAHALCTLGVYVLWWRKPLDVSRPVVIEDERLSPLLAYMWMASKTSSLPKPKRNNNYTVKIGRDPEFEAILLDGKPRRPSQVNLLGSRIAINPLSDSAAANSSNNNLSPTPGNEIFKVTTTTSLLGTNFTVNATSTRWKEVTTYSSGGSESTDVWSDTKYHPAVFNLSPSDTRRWQLAHLAMQGYNLRKPTKNLNLITVKAIGEAMDLDDNSPSGSSWSALLLVFLSAAYGGLHALAWNAHFPSLKQRKLWRISVCVVASPLGVMIFAMVMAMIEEYAKQGSWPKRITGRNTEKGTSTGNASRLRRCGKHAWEVAQSLCAVLVSAGVIFLYVPARGYLVYESFRTVFFLPPGAFLTPEWTQYLIHVT